MDSLLVENIREILIISCMILVASGGLVLLLRPSSTVKFVPFSSLQAKKKSITKKKRKSKEPKLSSKKLEETKPKDKEASADESEQEIDYLAGSARHRKSIELELVPELLGEDYNEKHEPHPNHHPSKPILKNRNSVENVDFNSSGIHYEHRIMPKDEVEIVHSKRHLKDLPQCTDFNYKFDSELNAPAESPWSASFRDQDSTDEDGTENVAVMKEQKKRPQKTSVKIEGYSQTEPFEDTKQSENAIIISDLNAKLNKLNRELKTSNDEILNWKKKHSALEENYAGLKSREEDVSTTCRVLQQEINQLLGKVKISEREFRSSLNRVNTLENEAISLRQEKMLAAQEIQTLRQSINQLNGKLGVINTISNENLSLKNRLDQAESELRNTIMNSKNSHIEKENKWKADLSEHATRLQHCIRELDLEKRRADELIRENNELKDQCCARERTLEGLKEQFAAISQKQSLLNREKAESQTKFDANIKETRAQIATLTKQLCEAQSEAATLRLALDEATKTEQMVLVDIAQTPPTDERLATLEERLRGMEKVESELRSECGSLRETVKNLQRSCEASNASVLRVQQEKRSVLTDLDKYKAALTTAELALDALQNVAEKEDEMHRERVSKLESECQRLKSLSMKLDDQPERTEPVVKPKKQKKKTPTNGLLNDSLEEGEIRDNVHLVL